MMAKCKVCDEPTAEESMSKENLQSLCEIMDIKSVLQKICFNCIIVGKHLNDCNPKALKYFSKLIDKLMEKDAEKGRK